MASPQYEFTNEQNNLIGSLAGKMSFVGLFLVIVGVLNIIMALVVVAAIYRDRLPPEFKDRFEKEVKNLPEEVQNQYKNLPANNHLWAVVINTAVVGIFYLLMGIWTRSAASSFQQIVSTQGSDISHLMNALSALHHMYALVYMILVITLLLILIAVGLGLYLSFA